MWLKADIQNYTTTGLYSTTVSPTPVPSSELVLPPSDYFDPTDCYDFPEDFMFGVAGSAAQIEGAVALDGRSPSLLEKLVPGNLPQDYVANENYFLYKQDIERLAAMGVEYYSFTIPWTRILPFALPGTPINQEAIDHYSDLIDTVLDAGMQPAVTMMHFDSPLLFVDVDKIHAPPDIGYNNAGYQNSTFVDAFVNYGKVCCKLFPYLTQADYSDPPHALRRSSPSLDDNQRAITLLIQLPRRRQRHTRPFPGLPFLQRRIKRPGQDGHQIQRQLRSPERLPKRQPRRRSPSIPGNATGNLR